MTERTEIDNEDTLFIFIDESGDFDFSKIGSKFFILTAITTVNPLIRRECAIGARYGLLAGGNDLEYFHATEDAQCVRDVFYPIIKTIDYEIDSVIAEKCKTNWSLYESPTFEKSPKGGFKFKKEKVEECFYKQICETLLQYVVYRYANLRDDLKISKIVVVLDQLLTKDKREFVIKSIKTYINSHFGIVPYVYFHSSKSDINSQIADYCCWAIKKKWKDCEMRPYNEIKDKIKSEFDIFQNGTTEYY